MGILRLFLAISVVVGHTGPFLGLSLMPSSEAVRIFFMISGFYMSLVLSGVYRGKPLLFYSNRLLRLYPTFVVAQIVVLAVTFIFLLPSGEWTGAFLRNVAAGHWDPPMLVALIPNLTMFGSDVMYLLHHGQSGWHFTFGVAPPAGDPEAGRTGLYLMNPPAWSIGIELWFYLLAPWLCALRSRMLVLVAVASLALQLWIDHLHPWSSYFFFPACLCFFLYGLIAERLTRHPSLKSLTARIGVPAAIIGLVLLLAREFIPLFRNYSWMHYCVAWGLLLFLFQQAKHISWDRWVGDLSYPVYILHLPVMLLVGAVLGYADVYWVLAVTLGLATIAMVCVERPIDRWRHRRTLAKATGGGGGEAAVRPEAVRP